jgi:dipeptidyl aminopeptidase/acylaminoacyl peptidase
MVRRILGLLATLVAIFSVEAAKAAEASAQPASIQAAPPPVEDYGKLPGMEFVTLSPSGERYAFSATVGDKRKLFVLTTGNQALMVNDLGAMKVERIDWVGEDHVLVIFSSTVYLGFEWVADKDELYGTIAIDLKSNKAISIFGDPKQRGVAHTVAGYYGSAELKGHWYGYFGGYTYDRDTGNLKTSSEGSTYTDLYRVDLDTGQFELAAQGADSGDGWLVGPDGNVAARLLYNRKRGDWRLMSSAWSGTVLASGSAPVARVAIGGFGHTPGDVLLTVGGADHDILEELSLTGAPPKATLNLDEVGAPIFDPNSRLWIGSEVNEDDDKKTVLFQSAAQKRLNAAVAAFPGYLAHVTSFSADFNRMIVFTDGGDDSGTYWIVDIPKRSAEILGSVYPSIKPNAVGPVRWFDYKAADGLAMRGVLTLPPGRAAKNLPLVVLPHGGPEAHDRPRFDYWAQAFAARGYAVFQPNFRGSDGQGNAFRDAGFGQWGRKMQTDISDGTAELSRQGIVDVRRACIVGWSYGGYAALAGVTVQHGLYRCAFSYGGVADPAAFLTQEREYSGGETTGTRYLKNFLGVTTALETELNTISPVRLADRADAPVMLIHGLDDTVVLPEQSERMARALSKAGKPVELITLKGADHWLLREDVRIAMVKASVEFVMKNNPPDPSPASAPPAAAQ